MRKFLIIITLFLAIVKITAQSYLQEEQARLERVNTTEIEIDKFTNQNINTFDFTDVINNINNIKQENGQLPSQTDYQNALLYAKKERLRDYYFQKNPEKIQNYYAKIVQQCINGGFEEGGSAAVGYSFFTKRFNGTNTSASFNYISNPLWQTFNNNPITGFTPSPTAIATVVDSFSNDAITGLPRTNTGRFAIRLNNGIDGEYDVTRMTRQFVVTDHSISFAFALVLQDGGHLADGRNPYYQVLLRNSSGNIVYHRDIMADPTNTSLFTSIGPVYEPTLYTKWLCEKIQTWQYMGQTMTLEIILADCGAKGHFGYGYFDDFCGMDCTRASFDGTISLNPLKAEKCPPKIIPISGNFTLPIGGSIIGTGNGIFLDILDAATGNTVTTISGPSINGSNFVFNLSNYDFYNGLVNSILKYNFKVRLNYSINGSGFYGLQATNTNPPGPDLSFEGCTTPCFEVINIQQDQPITASQNFQAYGSIVANSAIYPNLTVDFRAGYEVLLQEGFYVSGNQTGKFHAYIAPCENNKNIIPQRLTTGKLISKALDETSLGNEIKIYPNPSSAFININSGNEKLVSWEMYDMSGKSVLRGSSIKIDVQNILKGSYLLKINLEKKQISKIVMIK